MHYLEVLDIGLTTDLHHPNSNLIHVERYIASRCQSKLKNPNRSIFIKMQLLPHKPSLLRLLSLVSLRINAFKSMEQHSRIKETIWNNQSVIFLPT